MYLMYPEIVIPKIKEHLGSEVKIVIMLRNPVEAYSGYQHVKRYNIKEDILEFREFGMYQSNVIFLIQI